MVIIFETITLYRLSLWIRGFGCVWYQLLTFCSQQANRFAVRPPVCPDSAPIEHICHPAEPSLGLVETTLSKQLKKPASREVPDMFNMIQSVRTQTQPVDCGVQQPTICSTGTAWNPPVDCRRSTQSVPPTMGSNLPCTQICFTAPSCIDPNTQSIQQCPPVRQQRTCARFEIRLIIHTTHRYAGTVAMNTPTHFPQCWVGCTIYIHTHTCMFSLTK